MITAGQAYTIGDITHVCPAIIIKGKFRYTPATEAHHLALLQLLQEFDDLCDEHGVEYVISGHTLLGAIRHEGFVPWVENAEVDIQEKDCARLETAFADKADCLLKRTYYGYKLTRPSNQATILLYHTAFSSTERKYLYDHPWVKSCYPQYRNSHADLHPRQRYLFESLTLWGPQKGELLCTRAHGKDCFKVAVVPERKGGGLLRRLFKWKRSAPQSGHLPI
jgi:hypothetical protein